VFLTAVYRQKYSLFVLIRYVLWEVQNVLRAILHCGMRMAFCVGAAKTKDKYICHQ
jgi:hypothetical protein